MSKKEISLKEIKHTQLMQKWIPIVNACCGSGISKQDWCRQNGLNVKTYFYWQKKIFEASTPQPEFAELSAPVPTTVSEQTVIAKLICGKVSAEIYSGIDSTAIAAIVRGLQNV